MAYNERVLLIRDFERICRGETSVVAAGQVLRLFLGEDCCYLAFEHGRICVATVSPLFSHTTRTLMFPFFSLILLAL
jgi:hypothetical protein